MAYFLQILMNISLYLCNNSRQTYFTATKFNADGEGSWVLSSPSGAGEH